jgi:hypothetical protein
LADEVGSLEDACQALADRLSGTSSLAAVSAVSEGATIAMPAIPPHKTATSEQPWDGPAAKANLKNDGEEAYYRSAYAWQDADGDPGTKAAYKFIHHEVSNDGSVGAANLKGCSAGIAILNGGRGGTVIPKKDRKGVYNHLAKHIQDAGKEPPDFTGESFVGKQVSFSTDEGKTYAGLITQEANSSATVLAQFEDGMKTIGIDYDRLALIDQNEFAAIAAMSVQKGDSDMPKTKQNKAIVGKKEDEKAEDYMKDQDCEGADVAEDEEDVEEREEAQPEKPKKVRKMKKVTHIEETAEVEPDDEETEEEEEYQPDLHPAGSKSDEDEDDEDESDEDDEDEDEPQPAKKGAVKATVPQRKPVKQVKSADYGAAAIQIAMLCNIAGKPALAAKFIGKQYSVKQAQDYLVNDRAKASTSQKISGHVGVTTGKSMAALESQASELAKQRGISKAKAFVMALEANPDLYTQYKRDKKADFAAGMGTAS